MKITQETESFFYVKSAFALIKRYWYLFLLSVITFVGLAAFYNWYAQPNYEVSTVILIEENKSNNPDPTKEFMKNFSIFSPTSDIQREILKMKSSDLVRQALEQTKSQITYNVKNGIKTRELYNESPFEVLLTKGYPQPVNLVFQVVPVSASKFRLIAEKKDTPIQLYDFTKKQVVKTVNTFALDKEYKYGDTIKNDVLCFKITADNDKFGYYGADAQFFFILNDLNALTYVYQKALNIEQISKEIQAASIKMKVKNPQKGIDFITTLTESYLKRNIEKKKLVAESTIAYFDKQLKVIEDSLKLAETDLQTFRSTNRIMDIGSKADQIIKGASDLENQKAELEARARYYSYINETLERNKSGSTILVPSSMGVNDQVLTGIIEEFIRLSSERNTLIQNKQNQSPYFNSLNIKITNQRNTLAENIKYLMNTNNMLLNSVDERLQKENAKISALPATERKLVGIERKYKLNDNIYNYLLEKKAEAQVAKASNFSTDDILEPAKLTSPKPVSPNKIINLSIGLVLGLLLPFVGFGIKSFSNKTIANERVLESITDMPSLGKVYKKKGRKNSDIMLDAPKSAFSESIRTLRSNIDYFLEGKKNKVILLTSTISGEGKSFNSLNLAVSFSLLGKKTILLDFDLRKPNSYQSLNVENSLGISSYLQGESELDQVLVSTEIANFDFIPAGPIPPNPVELIGLDKTAALIATLKERYDYIFIDTPPLGLVTEAFLLMKHADLKIFVVRENVTPKKQFVNLLKELKNKKVENIFWLLNVADLRDSYYGEKNEYFS